jgi:hypothetical protein
LRHEKRKVYIHINVHFSEKWLRRTESDDYSPPISGFSTCICLVLCRTLYARKQGRFVEARPELVRRCSDGGHFVTITSNFTAD